MTNGRGLREGDAMQQRILEVVAGGSIGRRAAVAMENGVGNAT